MLDWLDNYVLNGVFNEIESIKFMRNNLVNGVFEYGRFMRP